MTERILVFLVGQLGDTIATVPSLWAIRSHYPKARITLLCNRHPNTSYVCATDILQDSGLVDAILTYDVGPSSAGHMGQVWRMVRLYTRLRRQRFDTLVYMVQPYRSPACVKRDRRFFGAVGIRRFIGMDIAHELPHPRPGQPLPECPRMADLFLNRLQRSGIPVPPPGAGKMDMRIGPHDEQSVTNWISSQVPDGGRSWVGIGAGSKMPAKIWPYERFISVLRTLIAEHDVWPIFFGGPEDVASVTILREALGRGYLAAGTLTIRSAVTALRRCRFYLGNDTGTMHLAAAAGIPCVAIFSARDFPGLWYPYGHGHIVLRHSTPCEGCMLDICPKHLSSCLSSIQPDEVLMACRSILDRSR